MRLVTAPAEIITARSTSTEGWNPLTRAYSTTDLRYVLFAVNLQALGAIQARPGVQFSRDGLDWGNAPVGVNLKTGAAYATAADWTYGDAVVDLQTVDTLRLYVRFGLLTLNTSGTRVEAAQAQLSVQVRPMRAGTVTAGPALARSRGSTSTSESVFVPMGAPMPTAGITALRATIEMMSESGGLYVHSAYQLSNDGLTWNDGSTGDANSAIALGTSRQNPGIDYGTTFTSVTLTHQLIRFGVWSKNSTGSSEIEAGYVRLRVDWR